MMVVAVMAEALHLIKTLREDPSACQMIFIAGDRRRAENDAMRRCARWTAVAAAMLGACLLCVAQNQDRDPNRTSRTSANAPAPETRIDLNHATVEELLKAPGMTRRWAERIVRFRPYRTKQDLVENGVVTGEVYERIKDFVIAHRDKQ